MLHAMTMHSLRAWAFMGALCRYKPSPGSIIQLIDAGVDAVLALPIDVDEHPQLRAWLDEVQP